MECSRIDGLELTEEGDRVRREPLVGETWPSESLTELLVVPATPVSARSSNGWQGRGLERETSASGSA